MDLPPELYTRVLLEAIRMPPINVKWNCLIRSTFLRGFNVLPACNPYGLLKIPNNRTINHLQGQMLLSIWKHIVESPRKTLLIESPARAGTTTGFAIAIDQIYNFMAPGTHIVVFFDHRRAESSFFCNCVTKGLISVYTVDELIRKKIIGDIAIFDLDTITLPILKLAKQIFPIVIVSIKRIIGS